MDPTGAPWSSAQPRASAPAPSTGSQRTSAPAQTTPSSVAADPSVAGSSAVATSVPDRRAPVSPAPAAPPSIYSTPLASTKDSRRPVPTTYGYATSPASSSFGPGTHAVTAGAPLPHAPAADSHVPASSAPTVFSASGTTSLDYGATGAPGYPPSVHAPRADGGSTSYRPGYQAYGSQTLGSAVPSTSAPNVDLPEGFIPDPYVPAPSVPKDPPPDAAMPRSTVPDSAVPGSAAPAIGAPPSEQGQHLPGNTGGAAQIPPAPGRPNCTPGLEYLAVIEQIVIQQKVELMEVFCGIETCNCYEAKNSVGQLIYNIKENSGFCTRCCCGPRRCLEIDVLDFTNTAVIHIVRPLRCVHCCWFCCLQEMEVQAPPGTPVAQIRQRWSICHPYFTIYTQEDEPALNLVGPICTESVPCKCDVKFEVRTMNGVAIGSVTKEWGGLVKEYFTDTDTFNVSFPLDLDVNMKAALIAAALLIEHSLVTMVSASSCAVGMLDCARAS
ncbi:phospholipid scramblase 1-like isoform X2 [Dermacentor albipictus]|uniref:phospholipid scramblase 1-like isoform X2 n=1 Tax=Dermacentor albipictus TaxID=60249 RepID=UPI0038FCEB50